jgi:hypothetical protein
VNKSINVLIDTMKKCTLAAVEDGYMPIQRMKLHDRTFERIGMRFVRGWCEQQNEFCSPETVVEVLNCTRWPFITDRVWVPMRRGVNMLDLSTREITGSKVAMNWQRCEPEDDERGISTVFRAVKFETSYLRNSIELDNGRFTFSHEYLERFRARMEHNELCLLWRKLLKPGSYMHLAREMSRTLESEHRLWMEWSHLATMPEFPLAHPRVRRYTHCCMPVVVEGLKRRRTRCCAEPVMKVCDREGAVHTDRPYMNPSKTRFAFCRSHMPGFAWVNEREFMTIEHDGEIAPPLSRVYGTTFGVGVSSFLLTPPCI